MSDAATPPVKFSLDFTPEIDKYIAIYKKQQKKPTVSGFAQRIGTDEQTVWAWANKKKKDDQGNPTDQLARPNFYAAVKRLEALEKEPEKVKLTEKQELFCQLYASDREFFGNGVQSYIEAYDINLSKQGAYKSACSSAYNLLTNTDILDRINEIMELGQFNDAFVDKQLQMVIVQNADFGSKVAAIREYNKLKQRITEKFDHTSKGKPIPILGGISTTDALHSNNSNS